MIKEFIFATAGLICVAIGFFLVFPAWHETANALVSAGSAIGISPPYMTNIQTIATDLDILIGLSFIAMGAGMWVYVLLFAWRREAISGAEPEV